MKGNTPKKHGKKWVCVARTFGLAVVFAQLVDSTVFYPNIFNAGSRVRTRNGMSNV